MFHKICFFKKSCFSLTFGCVSRVIVFVKIFRFLVVVFDGSVVFWAKAYTYFF